jgi:hypothetical protein
MNQGFVPLTLSAQPKTGVQPQAPRPFRPLAAPSAPPPPAAGAEPIVTLEREGTRVTRIKIQCCCGHVIELACE